MAGAFLDDYVVAQVLLALAPAALELSVAAAAQVEAHRADVERIWDARAVGDDVVFRAGLGAVDRARAGFGPPFKARTWEPSITALDQSSLSAACSSASRSSCRRCHTPASCHSASRRQHVIPEPNPSSWGQELPRDRGVQHEQDAAQHLPVRHSFPSGVPETPWVLG
jgi:L-fuconate dehydratase